MTCSKIIIQKYHQKISKKKYFIKIIKNVPASSSPFALNVFY